MPVVSKAHPPVLQRKLLTLSNNSVRLLGTYFESGRSWGIRWRPSLLCPNLNQHISGTSVATGKVSGHGKGVKATGKVSVPVIVEFSSRGKLRFANNSNSWN